MAVCVAVPEGSPVGPVLGGVGEADRKAAEGDCGRPGALTLEGEPSVLRHLTYLSSALGPLPPLTPQPPEGLPSSPWRPPSPLSPALECEGLH